MKIKFKFPKIRMGEIEDNAIVKVYIWIKYRNINWALYEVLCEPQEEACELCGARPMSVNCNNARCDEVK